MDQPPLGVTLASLMTLGPEMWADTATAAQDLGYRSLWTAETTGPEAFGLLGALGATHRSMSLGTGVLALQLRTPMLACMGAATLQTLAPDNEVYLGIGISSPVVVHQWHGATYGDRPLRQTREYLELARACLDGESVTFDGEFYSCRKFRLGLRPTERRPKLVIGALNAKMLALAGELADGVLLNYLPASGVPWCVEQVRAAERRAGRPEGSCTIFAYVHVGVTDLDAARVAAQKDLFGYIVVDSYAAAFTRAGFGAEVEAVRSAHAERNRDAALAAVSDEMINAIDIVGDADHVAAAVSQYRAAGVEHPVVMPLPWGPDRATIVRNTLEAAAGR